MAGLRLNALESGIRSMCLGERDTVVKRSHTGCHPRELQLSAAINAFLLMIYTYLQAQSHAEPKPPILWVSHTPINLGRNS